ncbi:MAG: lipoate protein ligase C-terminal domain-containing protein [Anaerolineaceae bacterium]|nr:lipoate protein ligase C-terminal domain-containing protein [Anaerolineaceae bacterium]
MKTNTITRKFGKLLRLDVNYGDHIEQLKITGDFFLHPEDTLEKIVSELTGVALPFNKNDLIIKVKFILADNEAELIGISAEDFVNLLEEVVQ